MEDKAQLKKKSREIVRKLKKIFPDTKVALTNWKNPWELLVCVVLSAQCTDKKVNEVTEKLFKKYKNLDDYVNADPKEFEQDIKQIGLFRSKTKNILAAAKMVKNDFNGKVPDSMKDLIKLPGVARKTANIVLHNAYCIVEGIAVDTHVMRLSRRLGLTKHTNPVKIERDLMELIPKKDWAEFNYRLVDYGRAYCKAKPHDHENCPLKEYDL